MRVMLGTALMLCRIKRDRSRRCSLSSAVLPVRWALKAALSVSSVRAVMLADQSAMIWARTSGDSVERRRSLIDFAFFFCSIMQALIYKQEEGLTRELRNIHSALVGGFLDVGK